MVKLEAMDTGVTDWGRVDLLAAQVAKEDMAHLAVAAVNLAARLWLELHGDSVPEARGHASAMALDLARA